MNASSIVYLEVYLTKTYFGLTIPPVTSIVSKPEPSFLRTLRTPGSYTSVSYQKLLKYERPLRLLYEDIIF